MDTAGKRAINLSVKKIVKDMEFVPLQMMVVNVNALLDGREVPAESLSARACATGTEHAMPTLLARVNRDGHLPRIAVLKAVLEIVAKMESVIWRQRNVCAITDSPDLIAKRRRASTLAQTTVCALIIDVNAIQDTAVLTARSRHVQLVVVFTLPVIMENAFAKRDGRVSHVRFKFVIQNVKTEVYVWITCATVPTDSPARHARIVPAANSV